VADRLPERSCGGDSAHQSSDSDQRGWRLDPITLQLTGVILQAIAILVVIALGIWAHR
jgi:hypothetical protein